ncbi:GGDEF domain-containing protein [Ectothiorhodospira haloalkaliphila]|uniref:GGDEF domain-containing protein n=1 Tax=Ectothiorhodospira haloalkaliphila TaxID=421628 RepID=UPI00047A48FA|nr:GGDEF domain-containing protein [Ectothiorhodospira haloalkaliphila]
MRPGTRDTPPGPDLVGALYDYVVNSGRLLVLEVGRDGRIICANGAFRSRYAGFADVRGEPIAHFFSDEDGPVDIEPGEAQKKTVARVFRAAAEGERCLFHAYPLDGHTLLIGEVAESGDHEVVARMGNLTLDMSRLVRDLRRANRDLARVNALNEELARTDGLTRLANRRHFLERLESGVAQARSRQHRLSILMIDLDHFKRVNDTYGHAAGDRVLVAFADLLRALVRVSDLPGRLGGEEFGLYMFDTSLDVAMKVGERLRARTRELQPLGDDFRPSTSIGAAEWRATEDVDSLIQRADAAMYRAKENGRNRVVADR